MTSFGLFICRHIHDTLSISCENISLKPTHGSFPIFQFMPNCCTNPPGCAVLPNLTMKKISIPNLLACICQHVFCHAFSLNLPDMYCV